MIGTLLLARMRAHTSMPSSFGQHQVEDDQVGLLERAFEPGEAVARGLDLVAFVLEFEFEHAQDLRVVFDDEDLVDAPVVSARGARFCLTVNTVDARAAA